ncbi:DNA methyltransferase [Patescibacteria group bacterium]
MTNTFKNNLYKLLKKDSRLWDEKTKELNETLLKDLIDKLDEKLITLLLSNKQAKEKFFIKVKDVFVLKQNELKFFVDENKLDNSYTQYQNKIGLRVGNKLLSERNEVVLDWPFKDCVLEGGMTKEDEKRNEIFFNEVLAKDEIDRLENSKAFVNWKRYTAKSEKKVKELARGKDGTIKENLIIKGNNLLALHSLKEQFTGKVKLIYIDPPYNTGGDAETFTYNNNFKHSTWLTFVKNRLEIGKKLLRDDGFIAITIDHTELFYLGSLADEIFGRENRVGIVSIVHKPEGRNQEKFFGTSNEFMLVFAKDKNRTDFERVILDSKQKEKFDEADNNGNYRLKNFIRLTDGKYSLRENKPTHYYPIYISKDLRKFSLKKNKDYIEVFPITDKGVERTWKTKGDTFIKLVNKGEIEAKRENDKIVIYEKLREDQVIKTHWIKKEYHAYHFGTKLLERVLGRKEFSFPKSLYAVIDTLKLMTSDDDIILDFHAGSGTTGHATLALNKEDGGNRKFILVEQLDEHIEICIERNQKVLAQEKIDDNFIYLELAKWNEEAKEKILKAKSLKELEKLFDELYERYFLNYNVKTKEFKEKTLKEEGFKKLGLDEQKKLFVEMLDMNQMYVNFSERADKKYNLSKDDIALSDEFYNTKK